MRCNEEVILRVNSEMSDIIVQQMIQPCAISKTSLIFLELVVGFQVFLFTSGSQQSTGLVNDLFGSLLRHLFAIISIKKERVMWDTIFSLCKHSKVNEDVVLFFFIQVLTKLIDFHPEVDSYMFYLISYNDVCIKDKYISKNF